MSLLLHFLSQRLVFLLGVLELSLKLLHFLSSLNQLNCLDVQLLLLVVDFLHVEQLSSLLHLELLELGLNLGLQSLVFIEDLVELLQQEDLQHVVLLVVCIDVEAQLQELIQDVHQVVVGNLLLLQQQSQRVDVFLDFSLVEALHQELVEVHALVEYVQLIEQVVVLLEVLLQFLR